MDRDLGALLGALARELAAAETPVLAARGLTMWEYVVLTGLAGGAAPTQARLADAIRRDKTRLIPLLDGLEARGLLRRTPDPDDRRNRVVALTGAGRSLLAECRAAVRAMEDELLAGLGAPGRAQLRAALAAAAGELGV